MSRRRRNREGAAEGFPVLRPDVAGIDVGSGEHWVCAPSLAPPGRDVARFGATTPELEALAAWLTARGVTSVALESTGVYWIPVYEVLEAHGVEVLLCDARQLARVPGRSKSDVRDCEWIQRLHRCGLLSAAFRPSAAICELRTLVRDKGTLVAQRADWVRRMQKSLDQMNVRVHRAVADLDGVTGLAIVRAIVAGERDPRRLAALRDARCHKSEAEIAEQLTGHWRADHLFSLAQGLEMYDATVARIAAYDAEIQRYLATLPPADAGPPPPLANRAKAKSIRQHGEQPMREALFRLSGADLTAIDGLGVETVAVVLSEYGADLSRFPSEKHFVSHVKLAPHRPISGGKPLKSRRPASATARVGAALRMAAVSIRRSQTALGAYYRRIAARTSADTAVFATARKLAQLIYRLLRYGHPYVDEGAAAYEQRYQQARVRRLADTAQNLGYTLVPRQA
jgi:transposase